MKTYEKLIDLPAEALAYKQKLLSGLNTDTDRKVFDTVNAINALAMVNTDVVQVVACFSGNINEFFVNAFDAPDDHGEYVEIFRESVTLSDKDALEKLLAIESQLTELIIEAREEAEAKAANEFLAKVKKKPSVVELLRDAIQEAEALGVVRTEDGSAITGAIQTEDGIVLVRE